MARFSNWPHSPFILVIPIGPTEAAVRFHSDRTPCLSRGIPALVTSGLFTIASIPGLAQPATAPVQQACTASRAHSVVGQPYSPELAERARRAAGAREIRKIEPGGAYTMDLDSTRLNVEVDRADTVTGLRCG
ncbi:I78 family peptidase inhibitor [Microvirga makkahensis]|uniref:I78 family peptidase inhibitor n=1 Tax=Microvirga makkahensis TaxID=1128670 RepID=UPI001FE8B4E0|nr:I78 family peptidase inhibitor [Microvirga makkahensis]